MLLHINNTDNGVKNIDIKYKEFTHISKDNYIKNENDFDEISFDIIIDDLLENIFLFENNLRNFYLIDDDLKIFYLKAGIKSPWKHIIKRNGETIEDDSNKYNLDKSSLKIFKDHLGDILFVNKAEGVDFTHIHSSIRENIKKIYGPDYNEILIIQYMIKKNISCAHINQFNTSFIDNFKSLDEFHKLVFNECPLFNEYKDVESASKNLILKETFCIELSSLKRYSNLFSGKLNMPGLYLYKYLINYLKVMNKESIPARVLKKRGRKKKVVEVEDDAKSTTDVDGTESNK